jgi:hypothetical protein
VKGKESRENRVMRGHIICSRFRWAGRVARVGDEKCIQKGRDHTGRNGRKYKDNNKRKLK